MYHSWLFILCFYLPFCEVFASSAAETKGDDNDKASLSIVDLQAKLLHLEEKLMILQNELLLLRGNSRKVGETKRQYHARTRRDTIHGTQVLPETNNCVPGTPGCPLTVTPYSAAGSCILCPAGPRGYPGPTGSSGRDGRDGRDAVTIVTSNDGASNTGSFWTLNTAKPPSNTSGAVYVRWGHKECPTSSVLIYDGIAAGAHYGAAGNGANQLCLPNDPVYDNPVAGVGPSRAFLYSAEYQIDAFPSRQDRLWHELPCAVCKSPAKYSQLMVPGKNTCPSEEWTLEYGGYLMAERSHTAHKRSMYICVDREMQTIDRTNGAASTRALLDLVESRCVTNGAGGGLPCGPYIDGYELTCAVCTQ